MRRKEGIEGENEDDTNGIEQSGESGDQSNPNSGRTSNDSNAKNGYAEEADGDEGSRERCPESLIRESQPDGSGSQPELPWPSPSVGRNESILTRVVEANEKTNDEGLRRAECPGERSVLEVRNENEDDASASILRFN